jgi:hypothetical protein
MLIKLLFLLFGFLFGYMFGVYYYKKILVMVANSHHNKKIFGKWYWIISQDELSVDDLFKLINK